MLVVILPQNEYFVSNIKFLLDHFRKRLMIDCKEKNNQKHLSSAKFAKICKKSGTEFDRICNMTGGHPTKSFSRGTFGVWMNNACK